MAFERAGRAGDAPRQVEIEDEVLAQALAGAESRGCAQPRPAAASRRGSRPRRAVHGVRGARPPRGAGRCSRGEAQRGDEAVGARLAGAGEREGGAVVGRGAHERQAQRDVDAAVEGERLERDQRLVVIHGDRRVVGARAPRRGTACRPGRGRCTAMPSAASSAMAGAMTSASSRADQAAFAGMRIEPGDGDARPRRCRNRSASAAAVMRMVSSEQRPW